MKLSASYKVQNGCHNCVHRFCYEEYDEGRAYYCTFNAPARPLCGSVLLEEHGRLGTRKVDYEAWWSWEEGRKTQEAGICDNHKLGAQQ